MWRVNYDKLFLSIPGAQRRTGEPKHTMLGIVDYDFATDAADEEHEDAILAEGCSASDLYLHLRLRAIHCNQRQPQRCR